LLEVWALTVTVIVTLPGYTTPVRGAATTVIEVALRGSTIEFAESATFRAGAFTALLSTVAEATLSPAAWASTTNPR
jgi:energy-converting hydrogenase Eha subunit A